MAEKGKKIDGNATSEVNFKKSNFEMEWTRVKFKKTNLHKILTCK